MRTGKTIGTLAADNLIVDGKHDLDVKGVSIVQAANAKAQEVSVEDDMTASKAYASGGARVAFFFAFVAEGIPQMSAFVAHNFNLIKL